MPPADARSVSRRSLLAAAAVTGLLTAAGCSGAQPRGDGGGTTTPTTGGSSIPTAASGSARPAASPGVAAGADAESSVAALAAALLGSKAELTSRQRRVVTAARDAHRLHASVLRSPDPTARSAAGSTPGPTPAKPAKVSLSALVAAERSLANRHARVVGAARGLDALLFGSLSVAATTYASALGATSGVPIAKATADPPTPQVLDEVAGIQGALTGLHALIYGYQAAIGRLSAGSGTANRALAGLTERRALRDQLISLLIARKASVPAAEPAYAIPKLRSAGAATALIASMETAFVPFTGQWLAAAAQPSDHSLAWSTMKRAASLARSWGGPISAWPGWPA